MPRLSEFARRGAFGLTFVGAALALVACGALLGTACKRADGPPQPPLHGTVDTSGRVTDSVTVHDVRTVGGVPCVVAVSDYGYSSMHQGGGAVALSCDWTPAPTPAGEVIGGD
jgi:hypothetical protein